MMTFAMFQTTNQVGIQVLINPTYGEIYPLSEPWNCVTQLCFHVYPTLEPPTRAFGPRLGSILRASEDSTVLPYLEVQFQGSLGGYISP